MRTNTLESPASDSYSGLRAPIEQLITLAEDIDSTKTALKAEKIIKEMKNTQSKRAQRFDQLEALALLSREAPVVRPVVTDTAELLLAELEEDRKVDSSIGLSLVWSSLNTWDTVRDEATGKLCIKTLNSFRGEGQVKLVEAFVKAREDDVAFGDALEAVLTSSD